MLFTPPPWFNTLRELKARPEWLARTRHELEQQLAAHPAYAGVPAGQHAWFRLAVAPLALGVSIVVLVAVATTGVAAQQALPTGVLYPVKLATERVQLALVPTPTGRAALQLKHAEGRLGEVRALTERGAAEEVVVATLARYEREVQEVAARTAAAAPVTDRTIAVQPQLVRLSLVEQQRELERWEAAGGGVVMAGARPAGDTRLRNLPRVAVLRALKAVSEGELVVLGGSGSAQGRERQGGRDEGGVRDGRAATARLQQTPEDLPPVQLPVGAAGPASSAVSGEPDEALELRAPDPLAAAWSVEAGAKLALARAKLAALEAGVAAEGSTKLSELITRARAAVGEAHEANLEAASEGSAGAYRAAYRRALRAYQRVLEAEIAVVQGSSEASRGRGRGNQKDSD